MLRHVDFLSDDPEIASFEADLISSLWKSPPSEMDLLHIPRSLQESYFAGTPPPVIASFRPWQKELFSSQEWINRENGLILIPTAGGKTVVAEVAIAQLLERNPNAKVIYCLPFVSLAAEKYSEFSARFPNLAIRPFYANIGGPEFNRGSVAIATYEKAHALINIAQRKRYLDRISLVVIDEIHMVGDDSRGANVEALIAKLKLPDERPQILGLSATIRETDAALIGKWLGGFVFQRNERPSPITQFRLTPDGRLTKLEDGKSVEMLGTLQSIPEDRSYILRVITDSLENSQDSSVLVFVNTRKGARSLAVFIASRLKTAPPPESVTEARSKLIAAIAATRTAPDEKMTMCLEKGVAYHHAGLLLEERKLIEHALRHGIISCVVATTTLSAGINIVSVSTVIIENVYRTEPNGAKVPLTAAQYCQMAGRAGRVSSQPGRVVVLQHTSDRAELELIHALSRGQPGHICGRLFNPPELDRYCLQCLYFFGARAARHFAEESFVAIAEKPDDLAVRLSESSKRLQDQHLIVSEDRVSTLGASIAAANLGIRDGLHVYEKLKRAQNNCCFADDLHLLYICMPADLGFRTPPYREDLWSRLVNQHEHVFTLALGLSYPEWERMVARSHVDASLGKGGDIGLTLDQFYAACVLLSVIDEQPLGRVEHEFTVDRGTIESLQSATATLAGQVCKFCEVCGMPLLGAAINKFRQRLNYAVKNELLALMTMPSCTRPVARVLFNKGVEDPDDLVPLTVQEIAERIGGSLDSLVVAARLKEEAQRAWDFRQQSQAFEEESRLSNFPTSG
jgi:replicative superfamily II helicase